MTAVFLACFYDWRVDLGPGERGTVMVIAADASRRGPSALVRGLLHLVSMLWQLIEAERQDAIDLSNRIRIETPRRAFEQRAATLWLRLYSMKSPFGQPRTAPTPTQKSLAPFAPAWRPSLPHVALRVVAVQSQGCAVGDLPPLFRPDRSGPGLASQHQVHEPFGLGQLIAAEYEKDPVSAEAEYGAQFRNDIETFVSREAVEAVTNLRALEYQPLLGRRYVGFVDPSGGSNNSMTLAIAHKDEDTAVLDVLRERRPPFSPESVVVEFAELLKAYRVTKVQGDRYAGEWPREHSASTASFATPPPRRSRTCTEISCRS